jgi:hypothetical protein
MARQMLSTWSSLKVRGIPFPVLNSVLCADMRLFCFAQSQSVVFSMSEKRQKFTPKNEYLCKFRQFRSDFRLI